MQTATPQLNGTDTMPDNSPPTLIVYGIICILAWISGFFAGYGVKDLHSRGRLFQWPWRRRRRTGYFHSEDEELVAPRWRRRVSAVAVVVVLIAIALSVGYTIQNWRAKQFLPEQARSHLR
jgi:hypothetical protein